MLMTNIFDRFVEKTPVSMMARAATDRAMAPEALFVAHADKQSICELLFSSVVDLMGMVVGKVAPSIHTAYQEVAAQLPDLHNLGLQQAGQSRRQVRRAADRRGRAPPRPRLRTARSRQENPLAPARYIRRPMAARERQGEGRPSARQLEAWSQSEIGRA